MFATTKLVNAFLALGIEGARLQYHTGLRTGKNGSDISVSADLNALRAEVGGPVAVECLEVWERDHKRKVRKEGIRIVVPKFHIGVIEEAFKDGAGDVSSLVTLRTSVRRSELASSKEGLTSAQKECDEWEDHLVTKLLVEKEHPEHDPNWNETKDWHSILDNLQHPPELLDVCRELIDQCAGEAIGPKAFLPLAE